MFLQPVARLGRVQWTPEGGRVEEREEGRREGRRIEGGGIGGGREEGRVYYHLSVY